LCAFFFLFSLSRGLVFRRRNFVARGLVELCLRRVCRASSPRFPVLSSSPEPPASAVLSRRLSFVGRRRGDRPGDQRSSCLHVLPFSITADLLLPSSSYTLTCLSQPLLISSPFLLAGAECADDSTARLRHIRTADGEGPDGHPQPSRHLLQIAGSDNRQPPRAVESTRHCRMSRPSPGSLGRDEDLVPFALSQRAVLNPTSPAPITRPHPPVRGHQRRLPQGDALHGRDGIRGRSPETVIAGLDGGWNYPPQCDLSSHDLVLEGASRRARCGRRFSSRMSMTLSRVGAASRALCGVEQGTFVLSSQSCEEAQRSLDGDVDHRRRRCLHRPHAGLAAPLVTTLPRRR